MARAIDGVLRSALLGLACLVPWALPATAADTAGPPAKPTIRRTAFSNGRSDPRGIVDAKYLRYGASEVQPPMDTGQADRTGATAPAGGATAASAARTRISGQATFLYYKDLGAPRKFYTEVLGLVPYFETEWVTLYHPVAGATIGLVKEPGSGTSAKTKRSVVMVSLVTDDVAGWYRRLRHRHGVHIVKALYDHPAVPIRAFEIEDPAGYPIEFFQWLDPAPQ